MIHPSQREDQPQMKASDKRWDYETKQDKMARKRGNICLCQID